jgi:hypothetical protein
MGTNWGAPSTAENQSEPVVVTLISGVPAKNIVQGTPTSIAGKECYLVGNALAQCVVDSMDVVTIGIPQQTPDPVGAESGIMRAVLAAAAG